MGSLLQTSLQGMPLFPISALTVTLHLLSAAALPIFQQEPAIFRGPSIDIIKGEDYEDPSVERVSLFGDRDDVQGGDQPMEYYENMPTARVEQLVGEQTERCMDAGQLPSLLFQTSDVRGKAPHVQHRGYALEPPSHQQPSQCATKDHKNSQED